MLLSRTKCEMTSQSKGVTEDHLKKRNNGKFPWKIIFPLLVTVVLILSYRGRVDILGTLRDRSPLRVSIPAQVEVGSCYAYEYGYAIPVVMDYTPYKRELPYKLKRGQEKPLWLAVKNQEMSESLEEASLHVTFPPSVRVANSKSWVCLGTGSNACYIDFNRSLHPQGSICLEPVFVTPTESGPYELRYSIPAKNHQTLNGTLKLEVQ